MAKMEYKSQNDIKELNSILAEELNTGRLVLVARTSVTKKALTSDVWGSFCCVATGGMS